MYNVHYVLTTKRYPRKKEPEGISVQKFLLRDSNSLIPSSHSNTAHLKENCMTVRGPSLGPATKQAAGPSNSHNACLLPSQKLLSEITKQGWAFMW